MNYSMNVRKAGRKSDVLRAGSDSLLTHIETLKKMFHLRYVPNAVKEGQNFVIEFSRFGHTFKATITPNS